MTKKKTETTAVPEAAPKPKKQRTPKAGTPVVETAVALEADTSATTPAAEEPAPKKRARSKKVAEAEPKKEKPPREPLCVFALRLTEPERTQLHTTAGPRSATRLARQVLVAFANEDLSGFKAALEEARRLRG